MSNNKNEKRYVIYHLLFLMLVVYMSVFHGDAESKELTPFEQCVLSTIAEPEAIRVDLDISEAIYFCEQKLGVVAAKPVINRLIKREL